MLSTREEGVAPAATQVSAARTYFSAFGGFEQSTERTVWSGSNAQDSSETLLILFAVAAQLFATGS